MIRRKEYAFLEHHHHHPQQQINTFMGQVRQGNKFNYS